MSYIGYLNKAIRRFTVQLLSKKFELAFNLWSVVRLFT